MDPRFVVVFTPEEEFALRSATRLVSFDFGYQARPPTFMGNRLGTRCDCDKPAPKPVRRESVFLFLLTEDGTMVLHSKRDGKYHPLGGKLEPGETAIQGLIREVHEEFVSVDWLPKKLQKIGEVHAKYGDGFWIEHYFVARISTWDFIHAWAEFLEEAEPTGGSDFAPGEITWSHRKEGQPGVGFNHTDDYKTTIAKKTQPGENLLRFLLGRPLAGRQFGSLKCPLTGVLYNMYAWEESR